MVKLKHCVYIKGSSPQAHDKPHDWRPTECRKKKCFGLLLDCEHSIIREINDKEKIKKMISYLRKLKEVE